MRRRLVEAGLGLGLVASFLLGQPNDAQASVMCASTGVASGGTPGGLTVYQCTFGGAGDSVNIDWSYDPGNMNPVLTAEATVTLSSISATQLVLNIDIENTTMPDGFTGRLDITAIGFSGPEGLTSVTGVATNGTIFDTGGSPPPAFPGFMAVNVNQVDFCAGAGSNCAGGGPDGLGPGESENFDLTVTGVGFPTTDVVLGSFAIKWQTDFGSFEIPDTTTSVGEPASLALMGLGLAGLGLVGRRRKKAAQISR